MAERRRTIKVGDNLSNKMIYFNLTTWTRRVATTTGRTYNYVYVDYNNKIYSELTSSGQENLYVMENGVSTRIGYHTGVRAYLIVESKTLSSSFGTVVAIYDTTSDNRNLIYQCITADLPSIINVNNTNIENVYFNSTQINKIYFNGEQVF